MRRWIAVCGCLLVLAYLLAGMAGAAETQPFAESPASSGSQTPARSDSTAASAEPSASTQTTSSETSASPQTTTSRTSASTGTTSTGTTTLPDVVSTFLSLGAEGRVIAAHLTDGAGRGIAGYPLTLTAGNQVLTAITGEDGTAVFEVGETGGEVVCRAADAVIDGVAYRGTSASLLVTAPTPPPATEPTDAATTTSPTTTTGVTPPTIGTTLPPDVTTSPPAPSTDPTTLLPDNTFEVVPGTGTTSILEGSIAVSPLVDRGILRDFGLTAEAFDGSARLLIPDSQYAALSGAGGDLIQLNVRTSTRTVDDTQIRQALDETPSLSQYAAQAALTVELSLQAIDAEGNGRMIVRPAGSGRVLYTVQLPVPQSMRQCAAIGVALADDGGLHYLSQVPVTAGVMEFRISEFGSFTILGFGSILGAAGESEEGAPSFWVIAGLVLLGLVLAAGGILLYLVRFCRRPLPAAVQRWLPRRPTGEENRLILETAPSDSMADRPPAASASGDTPAPGSKDGGSPPVSDDTDGEQPPS